MDCNGDGVRDRVIDVNKIKGEVADRQRLAGAYDLKLIAFHFWAEIVKL